MPTCRSICSPPSRSSSCGRGLVSALPLLSTIETSSARMPSPTAAATTLAMPIAEPAGSARPFLRRTNTDAVGGCAAPNSTSLPGAMCTRTAATPSIRDRVLAISPSCARWIFCFSITFVSPNELPDSVSTPPPASAADHARGLELDLEGLDAAGRHADLAVTKLVRHLEGVELDPHRLGVLGVEA